MPPSASEPESGSVIAHAPIFSKVRRSRPHRFICSSVPVSMIVPAASPIDTPSDATMPGLTLHSSMVGISSISTEATSRGSIGGPSSRCPVLDRSIE